MIRSTSNTYISVLSSIHRQARHPRLSHLFYNYDIYFKLMLITKIKHRSLINNITTQNMKHSLGNRKLLNTEMTATQFGESWLQTRTCGHSSVSHDFRLELVATVRWVMTSDRGGVKLLIPPDMYIHVCNGQIYLKIHWNKPTNILMSSKYQLLFGDMTTSA